MLEPVVSGGTSRVTSAADPIQALEDLNDALATFDLTAANSTISSTSTLLAQI